MNGRAFGESVATSATFERRMNTSASSPIRPTSGTSQSAVVPRGDSARLNGIPDQVVAALPDRRHAALRDAAHCDASKLEPVRSVVTHEDDLPVSEIRCAGGGHGEDVDTLTHAAANGEDLDLLGFHERQRGP